MFFANTHRQRSTTICSVHDSCHECVGVEIQIVNLMTVFTIRILQFWISFTEHAVII